MNQLSDSESYSSDEGIRYKTESTRYKTKDNYSKHKSIRKKEKKYRRSRSRSRSPRRNDKRRHDASEYTSGKNVNLYSPKRPSSSTIDITKENQATIGPTLPSKANNDELLNKKEASEKSAIEMPESYGPALPPSLKNKINKEEETGINLQSELIGPDLPHSFKSDNIESKMNTSSQLPQKQKRTYGPQLPSTSVNKESHDNDEVINSESIQIHAEEDLEEDFESYGPLPPGIASNSKAHIALEERALQMKIDKLNPNDDQIVREEWMIELPGISKKFGLGPRQFRPNAGPDFSDRSSWTDTPQSKKSDETTKKVDVKKEAEIKELKKYDAEQEKMIKKHKKHKKEKSLVEIHQDNLSKKKKDEGPSVRRPFSRETDLKVNHFDDAQKKAILKKAQLLDDRFSRGQSKFL